MNVYDLDIDADEDGFISGGAQGADFAPSNLPDFFFDDPFAHAQQATKSLDSETGLTCELKAYETRYNSRGEVEILQVGKQRRRAALEKNSSLRAAIKLTRHYDILDKLTYTELCIQSPHIKKALREVIKTYPGLKLQAPMIVLRDTPKCLFHYRNEIAAYARTLEDSVAREHIQFVQDYAYQQMVQPMLDFTLGVEYLEHGQPGLEFSNLWMAFRPGDLIFSKDQNSHRVYRFDSMDYHSSQCHIDASYIESDGSVFGYRTRTIYIDIYDNYKPFTQLKAYPLKYHTDRSGIIERLSQRGTKYVSLHGIHYRSFAGNAYGLRHYDHEVDKDEDEDEEDEEDEVYSSVQDTTATALTERVIVDIAGFHAKHPVSLMERIGSYKDMNTGLDRTQLMLCTNLVPVFALESRQWCRVPLENLRDIQFNTQAFDKLILPANQKQMIHSLVTVHAERLLQFDDFIAGKGKGMVFLLHGESGTGKTLTAESIADYTKRPLYIIGCADLGITINAVERNLARILKMSTRWNAILLLDEADVFLERRSTHDLERNGLVSVFLRMLEYFQGIIFLTTNRINAFDPAVRSRVHMAIQFPKLTAESRRKLWMTFIAKIRRGIVTEWCDEQLLDELASEELNGRQIKNAVRTAYALAISAGQELSPHHLRLSLGTLTQFDRQLEPDFANSPADAPTPIDYGRNRKRPRLY